ncbi:MULTISPECIES: alkaline phosphatase family protein [unclassified Nocardia]|uniref:alkaline phosphatase family protein n=1 Tax=unclassified Nocardia TaxID=2637762 RepID=UPI001CE4851C|nr:MULTISPECIES: alkaline phosphatase family protein [unclassified Nocardia]
MFSAVAGAAALTAAAVALPAPAAAATIPKFDHIVLVMFENTGYDNIIGSPDAPYFNQLADNGALFTDAHALTHPSQPNYIALFSGDTQGVTDDGCPYDFTGVDNLGNQLNGHGYRFVGYSEDMPSAGYTGCSASDGQYRRKHNGWVDFDNVPKESNQPYSAFPTDFTQLPTVSFVTPNMCNDIHDCPVSTGDSWLKDKLSGYADWAKANNSLLIITFDEDEGTDVNRIPTIFYGATVNTGQYGEHIDHYSVLRTIEDAYGLTPVGNAAGATPITDVWNTSAR